MDVLDGERPPGYAAAGRTDAGVSALAQTVAFDAPDWLRPAALNSELPADVRAWASADAPREFHATHDAAARTYTYHLHAPDADAGRADRALDGLRGTHDFRNLTPDDGETTRELSRATVEQDGPYLVFEFRAPGFLRQQVRRTVSLVAEVTTGAAFERIDRVLGADPVDGPAGVAPAPPEPLVLTGVAYPGLDFERDPRAAGSARDVFEEKRVTHATAARVAGAVADRL
jgi:tRNA pseudouridine38-40 synthase